MSFGVSFACSVRGGVSYPAGMMLRVLAQHLAVESSGDPDFVTANLLTNFGESVAYDAGYGEHE